MAERECLWACLKHARPVCRAVCAFPQGMVRPAWRWMALAAGLMIGAIFGWTQQVRGAHFLSHDLWTLLICWVVALGLFMVWQRWFVDGSGDVYSSGFQA